ncbi:hypothetical protein HanRHA438_Chr14g0639831 [Helianthus annuus]|nr:hypothetical protein HanHA89_Chr14g0558971 [Helianthus annuus]KAJ0658882.1 hypothetical protein HanOQP8_Chr14g0519681 [Helianthus annuus]KAJ0852444.1 hypothetical protein HanRHA438_Chr14g0639831 [Helianthus annuus]
MHENPTRAFTFPEGVLAMGGLSPLYSVRPRAFFRKKGDCGDIKFMVGDKVNPEMGYVLEKKAPSKGSSVHAEDSFAVEKGEEVPSQEESSSEEAEGSRGGDPRASNIRLRLQSASGQKPFPATKAASAIPPVGSKGSLSKHLRSSSLVSEPLLATGTSKPSQPEDLFPRSPLAPLFVEALLVPYVPKWKINPSTVVETPETAWDFLDHAAPPPHKFMNFALNTDLFDDRYSMSLYEEFFRGAGMLQRVNKLRGINEGLKAELKTSQTVAAELQCRVTDVERKLLEEKNAGALLEQRERAWERERMAWAEEKEELVAE